MLQLAKRPPSETAPEDDPEDEPEDDPAGEPEDDPEGDPPEDDPEGEPEEDPEPDNTPPSGMVTPCDEVPPHAPIAKRVALPTTPAPAINHRTTTGTSVRTPR